MRAIVLDETLEISDRAHQVLSGLGVEVVLARSPSDLDVMRAVGSQYDLLIANVTGRSSGSRIAEHLRTNQFEAQAIMLVDRLDAPSASMLARLPRGRCVTRPRTADELEALLAGAAAGARRLDAGRAGASVFQHGIVGQSRAMQDTFSRLDRVAGTDANVWLVGESGTGKELMAGAIHHMSPRRHGPFVPLDCTTVPEGLMESHLFGHVKGAFTGAIGNREGVFGQAHTGTLFIDELGDLSLPMQAKLLRVVQSREFVKVGGDKPIRSNIRLVCATNKDPRQAVDNGTFREDLYFRLAVVVIRIPPLRDRRDDIPLLVEHFVQKSSAAHGKPIRWIDPAAMERLIADPWPGNVRQLQNVVERAVVMTEGDTLTDADLVPEERLGPDGALSVPAGLTLAEVERRYIFATLQAAQGNRTDAARRLGISIRALQYKLKAYQQMSRSAASPLPTPLRTEAEPWLTE